MNGLYGPLNLEDEDESIEKTNMTLCLKTAALSPFPSNVIQSQDQSNLFKIRSSLPRCSIKKVFLEISQNSQENTSARVSLLIKLQA